MGSKSDSLPNVVVANLHKNFTGVSATVSTLVPVQRKIRSIGVLDTGGLMLGGEFTLWQIIRSGWTRPEKGRFRIWHARRDVEMLTGLFLKYILRQPWKLVFTSAAPKRHGRVLRTIINSMDGIIATSQRSADFLDWHSVIIPHGVDTEAFQPGVRSDWIASKFDLKGKFYIGNFGRIRYSKGTDLVVEALVEVLPMHPEFSAFFTGASKAKDAEFLEGLTKKVENAGLSDRIKFLGDQDMDSVKRLYQSCDLCIAASRVEGFGLTPLEAMASGCAVITSQAGYWPELMQKGDVGFTFKNGNASDLAAKLESALSNPSELSAMGKRAREYVVAKHAIQNEANAINQFYDQLVAQ